MKILFYSVGKQHEAYIKEGINLFNKRIEHYYPIQWTIIPVPKNAGLLNSTELKKKEGSSILNKINKDDYLVLLDEKGKQMNSLIFAQFIQAKANENCKNLIFLIGGAYGVSDEVFQRANFVWSLSLLVFPHQLVRIILLEQVYRACTINKNEKYHHV